MSSLLRCSNLPLSSHFLFPQRPLRQVVEDSSQAYQEVVKLKQAREEHLWRKSWPILASCWIMVQLAFNWVWYFESILDSSRMISAWVDGNCRRLPQRLYWESYWSNQWLCKAAYDLMYSMLLFRWDWKCCSTHSIFWDNFLISSICVYCRQSFLNKQEGSHLSWQYEIGLLLHKPTVDGFAVSPFISLRNQLTS